MGMPMGYHLWGTMLEYYQKHMLKLAEIKDRLSTIQKDLLHEFILQQISIMHVCCCNWWTLTL